MYAFEPEAWSDFFTAEIGAAAAILGLMVVAISINVDQILKFRPLPSRAAETVAAVAVALIGLSIGLVPAEDSRATGGILFWPILVCWLSLTFVQLRTLRRYSGEPQLHGPQRILMLQVSVLPFLLGAISLLVEVGAGFYLLAFGGIATMVIAVANAWVVLIEIRR